MTAVYLKFDGRGFKFGIANDGDGRHRQYITENPTLEAVASFHVADRATALEAEEMLRNLTQSFRLAGREWCKPDHCQMLAAWNAVYSRFVGSQRWSCFHGSEQRPVEPAPATAAEDSHDAVESLLVVLSQIIYQQEFTARGIVDAFLFSDSQASDGHPEDEVDLWRAVQECIREIVPPGHRTDSQQAATYLGHQFRRFASRGATNGDCWLVRPADENGKPRRCKRGAVYRIAVVGE